MTNHVSDDEVHANINDGFFDRFEALTFDDVVVIPGWSETLPDADPDGFVSRRQAGR
ncbi:MAG: hypothetical protein HC807_03625 [Gammaproteobacteria bacterium]|nr:hypothetical protein [Gammaproteobacteria bacterium]